MLEHFGKFMLLELWTQQGLAQWTDKPRLQPGFEIVVDEHPDPLETIQAFTTSLEDVTIAGHRAAVTHRQDRHVRPPGMRPIPAARSAESSQSAVVGLVIRPIFRDSDDKTLFPLVLARLRRQLARAIRKAVARFSGLESANNGGHYECLGPTSMVKAARLVDQQLSELAQSFDFLLQVTPTNAERALDEFREGGYDRQPFFVYRPLPYSPTLLKRRLFGIEIERVEDTTLGELFSEKQAELDRQLSALRDLETPEFVQSSIQLFGQADESLVDLAIAILDQHPSQVSRAGTIDLADADRLIELAREEIDYYRQRMNGFAPLIEKCDHIAAGLMVSRDRLLISESVRVPQANLQSLLHHEVGTHLLTYFNGRAQPLQQLCAGLAGYEELQEGLAVLAEYLTGGLTSKRLRTLAGRVVAVRSMTDGLRFAETFARLRERYGLPEKLAFMTALRAYRGGGLTKDVIYLRGLRDLLAYLSAGHDVEPLYVGKIALRHVPQIQEMRRRGMIVAPAILPRFWEDERTRHRIELCRNKSISDLVEIVE